MSGMPAQHRLEEAPQLETSKVVAEAEVRADSEGNVIVRVSADVEPEGIVEDRRVTVCRPIEQQQFVAGFELAAR